VPSRPACLALFSCLLVLACGGSSDPTGPSGLTQDPGALNMRVVGRLSVAQMTAGAPDNVLRSGSGNWGYTSPDGRRFALTGTSAGTSIDEVTACGEHTCSPARASSWPATSATASSS